MSHDPEYTAREIQTVRGRGRMEFRARPIFLPVLNVLSNGNGDPSPSITQVFWSKSADTIRGGSGISVGGPAALTDESLDASFLAQSLPEGWSSTVVGSGAVQSRLSGLLLTSGPTVGSSASVESAADHTSCELRLSVQLVTPPHVAVALTPVAFRFHIDAANYAEVRLRRDPAYGASLLVADAVISTTEEPAVLSGGAPLTGTDHTLRIVRHQNHVFLFVGELLVGHSSRFRSTLAGAARVTTSNDGSAASTSTRVTSMKVRSHCLVGDRLILNKVDLSKGSIVGVVPPATLAETGRKTIILFGPWGSASFVDGFEYTLPDGRTVGRGVTSSFSSYVDPAVKD